MANKTTSDGVVTGTLQRGKACLRCRKRKMRCDGVKPACQQCIRAKKAEGCEYDDGKGKTRTQILRETITKLEQRIRELEDPEYISPAVTLYDPHAHRRSGSSSSSLGSPSSTPISASHSPFPSDASSPHGSWAQLPGIPSPSPSPFSSDIYFEEPRIQQPPVELAQMLVDIFAPHRHQSGLEVHIGRLRESLTLPPSEQRHPVLFNSIYLWACFVSRPEPLCQHEDLYLTRALEALGDALRFGDKTIDVIQASCLLSMYFLANGRIMEGSYHASAAAGLAVQAGLHRGISIDPQSWVSQSTDVFDLKPIKDDIKEGERVLAFWQVYNLDRCWSVILRRPSIIPDGPDAYNTINTPWPQDMSDYESGRTEPTTSFMTIKTFLSGNMSGGYSIQALRAKASALFHRADQLATVWDPRMTPSGHFLEEVQSLERAITQFIPTLIPAHQLDAAMPEDKPILFVIHTLVQAAIIRLYQRFSQGDPVSYAKCLRAARCCVGIIKHISEADFNLLDPIIGHCWTDAAEILLRELNNIEASWPLLNNVDVRNEISVVLYATTGLSVRFPMLGAYQHVHPSMKPLFMSAPRPLTGEGMQQQQQQQQQQQPPPPQQNGVDINDIESRLERSSTCRRISRTG